MADWLRGGTQADCYARWKARQADTLALTPQEFNVRWNKAHVAKPGEKLLDAVERHAFKGASLAATDEPALTAGHELRQSVRRAARNVLLANTVVTNRVLPSDAWADRDGPRATLQAYFRGVLRWFSLSPPREEEPVLSGNEPPLKHALAVVGPTGSGKTMVGANYLAAAGIGEPAPDGTRRRAIWITVDQQLVRDCLNPNKTLQKCLPAGVMTTAIWEDNKDESSASGDLVCVTKQSLQDALKKGLIRPEDFDLMIFDEAHEAMTVRLIRLLECFDCPKILMTATPRRNERRNLLKDYHYVRPLERREAIEQGILSPTRIMTLEAESDMHAEHIAALSAVHYFIKEGKKCVVYCQAGNNNAQAERIAKLINVYASQMMGEAYDDMLVYAEMVGTANTDSEASIAAFESQTHGGARTTCRMLGQGWDYAELDGAIWVGRQDDFLALDQESGRPLRPKADGREALLIEITTPFTNSNQPRYCLAQTVGLEYIPGANFVIGARQAEVTMPPLGEFAGQSGSGGSTRELQGVWGAMPWLRLPDSTDDFTEKMLPELRLPDSTDDFTEKMLPELRSLLMAPGTSIAEIIIAPERRELYVPPPEFSVTDTKLATDFNVPVSYVRYHLERHGPVPAVPFKLIRRLPLTDEQTELGEREYQRYYHKDELAAHLERHPMPVVSSTQIFAKGTMADMLHAPESAIDAGIAALELPKRPPTRAPVVKGMRTAHQVPRYSLEEYEAIAAWYTQIPLADLTDEMYARLVERFPFARSLLTPEEVTLKRHRPDSARMGTDLFVKAATVQFIEAEHVRRKQLVSLSQIATRAGTAVTVVKGALHRDEVAIAQANRFTPPGGTRHAQHLPELMAKAVEQRVRPQPLELDEVTFRAVLAAVDTTEKRLRSYLRGQTSSSRILPGDGWYQQGIYTVRTMEKAETHFGKKPGVPPISYTRLVSDEEYSFDIKTKVLGLQPQLVLSPSAAVSNVSAVGTQSGDEEARRHHLAEVIDYLVTTVMQPALQVIAILRQAGLQEKAAAGKLSDTELTQLISKLREASPPAPVKATTRRASLQGDAVAEASSWDNRRPDPTATPAAYGMLHVLTVTGSNEAAVLVAARTLGLEKKLRSGQLIDEEVGYIVRLLGLDDGKQLKAATPFTRPSAMVPADVQPATPAPAAVQPVAPVAKTAPAPVPARSTPIPVARRREYEAARRSLGCDPLTFDELISRSGVHEQQIERDAQGRIVAFDQEAVQKMDRRIGVPTGTSWTRVGMLARLMLARLSGRHVVDMETLLLCLRMAEHKRGRAFSEGELLFGRDGSKVEIYIHNTVKSLVMQTAHGYLDAKEKEDKS